jgi:predicted transposase/invertase (TIGR01784 family)
MKRDTIFYRIFQESPTLLFELLPTPPPDQTGFKFESIDVKETAFRIDGVITPPDATGTVFFSEVQMQPDPKLYERMFSEIGMYTYRRTDEFEDWQAVAIYPSRDLEQSSTKVPRELFESGRILPIFLDELGEIDQIPLNLGLLVLMILEEEEAIAQAKAMMTRARRLETGNGLTLTVLKAR